MEKQIQIAVVRADIMLCRIMQHVPAALIAVFIGIIVGLAVYSNINRWKW